MAEAEYGQRHFMRDIIKEDAPIDHWPHADFARRHFRQLESVRVLKNEMLVVEEKEIGTDTIYYTRRDVDGTDDE